MNAAVPTLSIIFMIVDLVIGIAVPVILFLFFYKKYLCSPKAFFTGCVVFLLFALVLEKLVHILFLQVLPTGPVITGNIWFYGIYGGLMAGIFEETGRFAAFKTVLKNLRGEDHNALMYGAGHGGFEMFMLLSVGMINNLIYSLMLNAGNASALTVNLSGTSKAAVESALTALTNTSPYLFLVSPLERFAAITAQIGMSVLVWFAVKNGGKSRLLFPLAILLHLFLDASAVILNSYIASVAAVEIFICAVSAGIAVLAWAVWKKSRNPGENTAGCPGEKTAERSEEKAGE